MQKNKNKNTKHTILLEGKNNDKDDILERERPAGLRRQGL